MQNKLRALGAWLGLALLALIKFAREVLSENGTGSFSRVGSAILIIAFAVVMLRTRAIPAHTADLAWVIAALYGAGQLKHLAKGMAQTKQPPSADTGPAPGM